MVGDMSNFFCFLRTKELSTSMMMSLSLFPLSMSSLAPWYIPSWLQHKHPLYQLFLTPCYRPRNIT